MEIITFICTVLGIIIAIITYKKTFVTPNKEKNEVLLEKFNFGCRLNCSLIERFTAYSIKYQCWDEVFVQGLTFRQCLGILNEARDKVFNADNEATLKLAIKRPNINRFRVENILRDIETQIKHHSEVDTMVKLYIDPNLQ